MINKSLGKLHKVRAQGEDNRGNSYASLEQMWKAQLDPVYQQASGAAAAEESKSAAGNGTKGAWYQGSVQYWDQ